VTLIKLPTWATWVLALLAGVIELLNVTTFGFAPVYQNLVTIAGSFLAALGISPLTHDAIQNMLHLTHTAALSLATAFATASAFVTQLSGVSQTTKGIIIGVLALVAGVLFGPAGSTPSPAPPPAPAAH